MRTSNLKPIIALTALALSLIGASFFSTAQSQTANASTTKAWKTVVVDADKSDVEGTKDTIRLSRGARFDDKDAPNKRPLDSPDSSPSTEVRSNLPPYWVRIPAIPVEESDTVFVGKIVSFQPYFSNDHTHLYTEISLGVETLLKDRTQKAQEGRSVPVLLRGGRLRLPGGRIIEDDFAPTSFRLEQNCRYVLFLRYVPNGDFFQAVKSWELHNSSVVPTANEDIVDAKTGKSSYAAMSEAEFIRAVTEAITSQRFNK